MALQSLAFIIAAGNYGLQRAAATSHDLAHPRDIALSSLAPKAHEVNNLFPRPSMTRHLHYRSDKLSHLRAKVRIDRVAFFL
jgi:hypothetical protein